MLKKLKLFFLFTSSLIATSCMEEEPKDIELRVSIMNNYVINPGDVLVVFINDLNGDLLYSEEVEKGDVVYFNLDQRKKYHLSYYNKFHKGTIHKIETYSGIDPSKSIYIRFPPTDYQIFDRSKTIYMKGSSEVPLKSGMISLNNGFYESFNFFNYLTPYQQYIKGPQMLLDSMSMISFHYPDGKWKYALRQADKSNYIDFEIDENELSDLVEYMDLPTSKFYSMQYNLSTANLVEGKFIKGYSVATNYHPHFSDYVNNQVGFTKEFDDYILHISADLNEFKDVTLRYKSIGKAPKSLKIPYPIIAEKGNSIPSQINLGALDGLSYYKISTFEDIVEPGRSLSMYWNIIGDNPAFKLTEFPESVLSNEPDLSRLLTSDKLSISTFQSPFTYSDILESELYNNFDVVEPAGEYFEIHRIF
ncbi:hypothetical protein SAMN04489724_3350 [Algoriphagus locisalis]|uniref:Uncharacterized protein n=1 Tax=Algoriphagus locisalis TaxID=305507 RepID=A0A1I7CRA8_9BACT|nr:hypothetical protein [Algoriphagus locisalis]SFU01952.1 hypothetical protein SAMN04489724_3350 [Algoriphagus locisalis]